MVRTYRGRISVLMQAGVRNNWALGSRCHRRRWPGRGGRSRRRGARGCDVLEPSVSFFLFFPFYSHSPTIHPAGWMKTRLARLAALQARPTKTIGAAGNAPRVRRPDRWLTRVWNNIPYPGYGIALGIYILYPGYGITISYPRARYNLNHRYKMKFYTQQ
jgi:hypothetical protein